MRKSNLLYVIAFILVCILMRGSFISPDESAAGGDTSTVCDTVESENEIREILVKWRDQIKPTLPADLVSQVEQYVANVPLETPSGSDVLTLDMKDDKQKKETDVKPQANRRDIAYALAGAGSSMLGGCYEGYEQHMDIAFWCFLEAALLKLEPDHLSNVAFYLAEKDSYDEAMDLLCFAWAKSKYNYGILCNLAHVLALKGQFEDAVNYQKFALALKPTDKHIKAKLKGYADKAGVEVYIPKEQEDIEIPEDSSESAPPQSMFPPDYTPSMNFAQVFQKVFMINMNNWMNNIFGKWSKNVWDPIHGLPGSSEHRHGEQTGINQDEENRCMEGCSRKFKALGPDLFECQCNCEMQHYRANLNSAKRYYNEAAIAYGQYRHEAHADNEKALEEMVKVVNDNIDDIYPIEVTFAGEFIQDNYLYNYEFIEEQYRELDDIWDLVMMYHTDLQTLSSRCSQQRMAGKPPIKPEDQFGKPPTVIEIKRNPSPYFSGQVWFWFGSMKMTPDGTTHLAITPTKKGITLKGKYNYKTNDWGAGVGIGLGTSKLGKAGKLIDAVSSADYTMFFDSKKGLMSDFTAEIRPKIGFWGGENPTNSVKIYH